VITAKTTEPGLDLRNAEVFNRILFTRDGQTPTGVTTRGAWCNIPKNRVSPPRISTRLEPLPTSDASA
jgi:hypothetical protein